VKTMPRIVLFLLGENFMSSLLTVYKRTMLQKMAQNIRTITAARLEVIVFFI
jgi:hypothetical protein